MAGAADVRDALDRMLDREEWKPVGRGRERFAASAVELQRILLVRGGRPCARVPVQIPPLFSHCKNTITQ